MKTWTSFSNSYFHGHQGHALWKYVLVARRCLGGAFCSCAHEPRSILTDQSTPVCCSAITGSKHVRQTGENETSDWHVHHNHTEVLHTRAESCLGWISDLVLHTKDPGRSPRCKHNIKLLKDYFESFGLHESGTGYCLSFVIDERSSLTTKDYISRLSWYVDSLCPLPYIEICVALCLSILNIFFSRSDKCTSILIWYQDILYLRHERVTKNMTMVSPTLRRIHLQREIVKGSIAETEIPLLSSFSSPVHVLNKVYPETWGCVVKSRWSN